MTATVPEHLTPSEAIANLCHPDLSLRYYAAWWLGRFQVREGLEALLAALGDEEDRTALGGYPLRRNAARALGNLGDRRAVPALVEALACTDFYVREAAAVALGNLGDPQAVHPLAVRLSGPAGDSVLGTVHLPEPYPAILAALGNLGDASVLPQVYPFANHSLPRVRYAAWRALFQLTQDLAYMDRLMTSLAQEAVPLQRVVLADLGATGYLPAAAAIAQARAENSFKLMALRGLVSQRLASGEDSARLVPVFDLMDGLL
ncbi:MAG: HEAT repeat domain-containing protein [Gloeomargaritaceae cyanobacterium C42_A2020_066]|nr:HEAT repeat domain-containing protein [Gloeomargaritaceae cyanobacterium C42_A2020_066]